MTQTDNSAPADADHDAEDGADARNGRDHTPIPDGGTEAQPTNGADTDHDSIDININTDTDGGAEADTDFDTNDEDYFGDADAALEGSADDVAIDIEAMPVGVGIDPGGRRGRGEPRTPAQRRVEERDLSVTTTAERGNTVRVTDEDLRKQLVAKGTDPTEALERATINVDVDPDRGVILDSEDIHSRLRLGPESDHPDRLTGGVAEVAVANETGFEVLAPEIDLTDVLLVKWLNERGMARPLKRLAEMETASRDIPAHPEGSDNTTEGRVETPEGESQTDAANLNNGGDHYE